MGTFPSMSTLSAAQRKPSEKPNKEKEGHSIELQLSIESGSVSAGTQSPAIPCGVLEKEPLSEGTASRKQGGFLLTPSQAFSHEECLVQPS